MQIQKLLIANRGEIARRIMRTCREMGIATVAVFSEPDRGAPFVREADEAVPLGGATPAESYLRADAIVAAAERAGADAVHPGYGFLAESAGLARAVRKRGLVWVGPPPEAIEAMASKLEAKRVLAAAGVPVLPSEGTSGLGEAELAAAAARLGWPVLVKAALGGGGKGMAVVRGPGELAGAVAAARRVARAAFGDGTVFLEPYLDAPRHVEVQILGDAHGQVVHLGERECSIQRRYQKVIEEAPSPAVSPELREAMSAAAVAAGKAIGYTGAGTVEFLLAPDGRFFFLEVNTRLQVEHPVTELVWGLDLVRLQLLVAQGEPLPEEVTAARPRGHAIEARLYAEDPRRRFVPAAGTLHRFRIPGGPGLRVDAGVEDGSEVSPHYDPLLAKVIAHAPTRGEAAARLAAALAAAQIHGVATNRDLLVRTLRHPAFLAGQTDTHFLDRHGLDALAAPLAGAEAERAHAVAAALAAQAARRARAPVLRTIPSGWRNNPSQLQEAAFQGEHGPVRVGYRLGRGGLELAVDGVPWPGARLGACTPELVELELDGVRRRYHVHEVDGTWYVDSPLGSSALRAEPRLPEPAAAAEPAGHLASPLPGTVLRVAVAPGDRVEAGAELAVVEAMKMEHRVTAPRAARVAEVLVRPGEQVTAGRALVVLEEEADG